MQSTAAPASGFWLDAPGHSTGKFEGSYEGTDKGAHATRVIDTLSVTRVTGEAAGVWRGAAASPSNERTFFVLAIQRRGLCTLRQHGREAVLAQGDVALYLTALPYELAFDGAFRQTSVAIPAAPMRALSASVEALAGVALRGTQPQVALLGMMADCYFDTDYAALPEAAAGHAAAALRQALAGCLLTQLGALDAKR